MYRHILIPTDGSELSERALRQGIDFAESSHAEVTLLTASPPLRSFGPDGIADPAAYEAAARRVAEERLKVGADYAREKGVKATLRHVFQDDPSEAIIDAAKSAGCDLVFMASHGRRGLEKVLLGSETQKVLTRSKVPVLVCR